MMENPIKMDDLGVPLFLETPTSKNLASSWVPNLHTSIHLIFEGFVSFLVVEFPTHFEKYANRQIG